MKLQSKTIKFFLKLVISLAFVSWLIFKINWTEVLFFLKGISLWKIAVYFIFLLVSILISSVKWKLLAGYKGIEAPLKEFFSLYLTGMFINNFMPSFIAGDTFKAYQLGKKEKRYIQAAGSVVVDRITGLIAAMFLTIVFSAINWQTISSNRTLVALNAIVVAALIMLIAVLFSTGLSFWKKMKKYVPEKFQEILKDFHEYNEIGILTKATLLGVVYNVVGLALSNYVLFWALGIKINIIDYFSVIFIISVVITLPISINNIGIKEWAYAAFFGIFGVGSAAVVAVALISRVLQMLLSFAALPAYLKTKE